MHLGQSERLLILISMEAHSTQDLSLFVRCKEGLYHAFPNVKNLEVESKTKFLSDCAESDYSPDGKYVIGYTSTGEFSIFKIDGTKLLTETFQDVANCYFSQCGRFACITYGAAQATSVKIFRVNTPESINIKIGFMKSGKRYLVFVGDYMAVQRAPNSIEVYNVSSGIAPEGTIEIVPSVELGGLRNSPNPLLYASNPNSTKDNQKGTLFEVYNLKTKTKVYSNFFAGIQQIDVFENPKDNRLLVRGHKFVDDSGMSYYGKNTLDLVEPEENKKKKITTYNGQIHSLSWSPTGAVFAVCAGFMPSYTALYDKNGDPFMVVLRDPKNSVYWSPNGEFLAVTGFGNLSGEIQIWHVNQKKLLGKCQHGDAGDLEWAPDGRHFITKVEYKFLREGNQFRVYDYHGTLINKVEFKNSILHSVRWFPKGTLITRPPSPPPQKEASKVQSKIVQEDFMAGLKEKSLGAYNIKLEDIEKANKTGPGQAADDKADRFKDIKGGGNRTEAEKRSALGFDDEPPKKKKNKKK